MLKHKNVIGRLALCMNINGNNIHFKTGRFCHLAEAHQNVIGKLVRFLVLDIVLLNNNAELPSGIFISPEFCIA